VAVKGERRRLKLLYDKTPNRADTFRRHQRMDFDTFFFLLLERVNITSYRALVKPIIEFLRIRSLQIEVEVY